MNSEEAREIADYINRVLESNQHLGDRLPVSEGNIFQQLHDGVILCCLANALAKNDGGMIPKESIKFQKATIFHKMDNVNKALEGFKKQNLSIVNIRAQFIVEKKQNSVIGLFNQITRQRPVPKRQNVPVKTQATKQNQMPKQQQEEPTFIMKEETSEPKKQFQQQTQYQVQKEQNSFQPAEIKINQSCFIPHEASNGYNFEQIFGPNVVVLCGSLRNNSFNKAIVSALQVIKSGEFFQKIHFYHPNLGHLPLFNQDLEREGRVPQCVTDLRKLASKANGILISTPQYNGCLSPVIKNALDWLSRSYENNNDFSPLIGKKIGIVGSSYLTSAGLNDAKTVCEHCKANCYPDGFYINLKSKAFDHESGKLSSIQEIDRLAMWYQDFSNFILSGKPNPEPVPRWILQR